MSPQSPSGAASAATAPAATSLSTGQAACHLLAGAQEGTISRAQALTAGLDDARIARELAGRRWQRSDHDGVYLVHTGPVSYLARCWAALLHAGPGAALGMETAAWVWGLLDDPPAGCGRREGVRVRARRRGSSSAPAVSARRPRHR